MQWFVERIEEEIRVLWELDRWNFFLLSEREREMVLSWMVLLGELGKFWALGP